MELAGRRFVLIGGAGLIGSHVAERLATEGVGEVVMFDDFSRGRRANLAELSRDPRFRLVEGDIRDAVAVRDVVQDAAGVFLLASLWLGECLNDPRRAWEVNVLGSWNVVEACSAAGVERVVYSSSASVYGNAVMVPMNEDHPLTNRTMYGATKIACEQMLRAMHDDRGLAYVALRYFNVYGPRMDERGTYVSVIVKALARLLAGEAPIIFGDGSQTYDFVHVDDIAEANLAAMRATCSDDAFNVATGIGTSINELVELLTELTGANVRPEHREGERSFVTRRVGGTAKAERMLGFRARMMLRDGLADLVAQARRARR